MKLHSIDQIVKKDIPLQYRNEYSAVGDIELSPGERSRIPIVFSVEMEPSGNLKINVKVLERISYPLLPVIRALKEEIKQLQHEGKLL